MKPETKDRIEQVVKEMVRPSVRIAAEVVDMEWTEREQEMYERGLVAGLMYLVEPANRREFDAMCESVLMREVAA